MDRDAIAEALYKVNPELQLWNGDAYDFAEVKGTKSHHAKLAYEQADAILELLASKG